jgi:hypothetical protein
VSVVDGLVLVLQVWAKANNPLADSEGAHNIVHMLEQNPDDDLLEEGTAAVRLLYVPCARSDLQELYLAWPPTALTGENRIGVVVHRGGNFRCLTCGNSTVRYTMAPSLYPVYVTCYCFLRRLCLPLQGCRHAQCMHKRTTAEEKAELRAPHEQAAQERVLQRIAKWTLADGSLRALSASQVRPVSCVLCGNVSFISGYRMCCYLQDRFSFVRMVFPREPEKEDFFCPDASGACSCGQALDDPMAEKVEVKARSGWLDAGARAWSVSVGRAVRGVLCAWLKQACFVSGRCRG